MNYETFNAIKIILILAYLGVATMGVSYRKFTYPVAAFLTLVVIALVISLLKQNQPGIMPELTILNG